MIHVVTANNRQYYRAQLEEMHQLRRVHFIEERGWSDLKVVDGGEYDQFDDDRAVYLLALGSDAEVLGSSRVRPTDDKCLLADVFPDLIGPDEWPSGEGAGRLGTSTRVFQHLFHDAPRMRPSEIASVRAKWSWT